MTLDILGSILGGAFGGIIGTALTLRLGYKRLFAEAVSKSRMDWINNFREEVGIIVAALSCPQSTNPNLISDAYKAKAKLMTRLNCNDKIGNEYNQPFYDVLKDISFGNNANNTVLIEGIIEFSKKILEPEWQRVKREAGGKNV